MIDLLNPISFILGLIAWILPIVNIMRYQKNDYRSWVLFSLMSISACALSLCFQIINIYDLVRIGDLSALMDTIGAVAIAASVLFIVTIILNAITLMVYRARTV